MNMKQTAVIDRRYSGLRIVEAEPADVKSVLPLFLSYLEFYKQVTEKQRARQFLRDRLAQRESKIFLAMLDGEPVGFAQLYPTYASLALRRSWILYDLFVVPAARKRGVGQALLEKARQLAVKTGAEGITLETAKDNRPAQRLYEGLGYRRDTHFYRYHLRIV
jgi:GNAT superfamily N-acetyltransferase